MLNTKESMSGSSPQVKNSYKKLISHSYKTQINLSFFITKKIKLTFIS